MLVPVYMSDAMRVRKHQCVRSYLFHAARAHGFSLCADALRPSTLTHRIQHFRSPLLVRRPH